MPQQAARIRVLLLVRLAERQRGAGAPATSSVDLRNSTLMQQSGLSAEMPGCRPFQQREGYGRWWLLRHESDSPVRLLVAADWPARKHPATAARPGRAAGAAGPRGRAAWHLLTSPRSACDADSPAFVCEQVRAVGVPVPRVWRGAGSSRRSIAARCAPAPSTKRGAPQVRRAPCKVGKAGPPVHARRRHQRRAASRLRDWRRAGASALMDRDPHSCSLAHRTARGLVTACVRQRQRKPDVCEPLW